ncbi:MULTISPECIES: DUF5983 family protein [Sphingobium]|uniref:DUF5983 domain-containing protein n=1 Tax=Sphingobium limneticum TaxID=1007511 RepID=A0A5J5HRI3_9SPHN|nr:MULTISPECIES: hypothetical protein [Sphingobium]KAA9011644.1 hypothetical protein F4U94_20255 [Sphingobium limneticum]KAA9012264.1 hypothetical protein F4U96_21460 [Sphingobium limneticum]KAA9024725.1 hypothetical protein F4U95_21575 [Sphingobium limneticum]
MEIGTHLVLSTAHVTHATSELLTAWAALPVEQQPLTAASTWYGWFVSTYAVEGDIAPIIPPDLVEIQRFARSLGCAYILFDCDGDTVAALRTFSW